MKKVNESGRQCIFMMAAPKNAPAATKGRIPCNREPSWLVKGKGYMCPYHFEKFMESDMPDPASVVRLSNDDNDFIFKSEPGKGPNEYSLQAKKQAARHATAAGHATG